MLGCLCASLRSHGDAVTNDNVWQCCLGDVASKLRPARYEASSGSNRLPTCLISLDPWRPQGFLSYLCLYLLLNFTRGINSCNFAPVTISKGVLYNMWNWYSQWKIACKFLMAVQWLFGGLISSGIKWGNLKLLLCHLIRLFGHEKSLFVCISPFLCRELAFTLPA